jgi:Tfp pilus assembly protein PilE
MRIQPPAQPRQGGFFHLEVILLLMILAVLAFLAVPVYNTLQESPGSDTESLDKTVPTARETN